MSVFSCAKDVKRAYEAFSPFDLHKYILFSLPTLQGGGGGSHET